MPYSALWEGVVLPARSLTTLAATKWLLQAATLLRGFSAAAVPAWDAAWTRRRAHFGGGRRRNIRPAAAGGCGTTAAERPAAAVTGGLR